MSAATASRHHNFQFVEELRNDKNVAAWLEHVKVKSMRKAQVVEILTSESVYTAFKTLLDNNILSAPVVDADSSKVLGLVDMLDIAHMALDTFDTEGLSRSSHESLSRHEAFMRPVMSLQNLSRRNPYVPLPWGTTLGRIMKLLGERGLHRVCIVNEDDKIEAVLSQSSLIAWIDQNVEEFGDVMNQSVADCGFIRGPEHVVTLAAGAPAHGAFRLMFKQHVSAVALHDDDHRMVGFLAANDIKAVQVDGRLRLGLLQEPAVTFMTTSHQMSAEASLSRATCSPRDTLRTVVRKLTEGKMHRIFVVDGDGKPVTVLSLRDIIHKITEVAPTLEHRHMDHSMPLDQLPPEARQRAQEHAAHHHDHHDRHDHHHDHREASVLPPAPAPAPASSTRPAHTGASERTPLMTAPAPAPAQQRGGLFACCAIV